MNHIEIDLTSLVFVGLCGGGGVLFEDGDGDEIVFWVNGTQQEIEAAVREFMRAAAIMEGL